jgi:glutathione S-transferase
MSTATTASGTTAARSSGPQKKLVLWHVPVSNYSEKTRWALDYKGLDYDRKTFRSGLHQVVLAIRGRGITVPVLDIEGRGHVSDSTDIIAALEQLQPEPPLYPGDEAQRREALELEDYFDDLGHDVRRVAMDEIFRDRKLAIHVFMSQVPRAAHALSPITFPLMVRPGVRRYYRVNDETVKEARRKVIAAFELLDARLEGGREYLVGDRFSVADLTAAALMYPLFVPPEFPYPTWDPATGPRGLREFRDSLKSHRAFEWGLEMYRRYRRPHAGV